MSWLLRRWKDRTRRRVMTVTDITRMDGDRVCVGGYLDDGTPIRPIAGRAGPNERWLQPSRDVIIAPFSVIALEVRAAPRHLRAPHTEDRLVPERGHRVLRALPNEEQIALLAQSASPSVRAIFGAEIHADAERSWARYVRSGEGSRSLGTIRAGRVEEVRYRRYAERGRWDYRLRFRDESGEEYQLAVVDLDFRRRLDARRAGGASPEAVAAEVKRALQRQHVFLRIGLARGWDRHPDRCYLQVTGVYGFAH
jgi:hypothetical protein